MNWKSKAVVQRCIAALPEALSLAVYYWLQRRMGGLREADPMADVRYGADFLRCLKRAGRSVAGLAILEVGTGRRLNLPLTWWLCGARSVTTVDLSPYLKLELVLEDVVRLQQQPDAIRKLLGGDLVEDRLQCLLSMRPQGWTLAQFLEFFSFCYLSPTDAASLSLEPGSIDIHTSNNVLEHIPGMLIGAILREGARVLSPSGMFIHRVDFSDHFARDNAGISLINFLTYSQREWDRIAGNRFMYMNRLRVDDMDLIFDQGGVAVSERESVVDEQSLALLQSGALRVDAAFSAKPFRTLATTAAWYVGTATAVSRAATAVSFPAGATA